MNLNGNSLSLSPKDNKRNNIQKYDSYSPNLKLLFQPNLCPTIINSNQHYKHDLLKFKLQNSPDVPKITKLIKNSPQSNKKKQDNNNSIKLKRDTSSILAKLKNTIDPFVHTKDIKSQNIIKYKEKNTPTKLLPKIKSITELKQSNILTTILYYFRHRPATLLNSLGKKDYALISTQLLETKKKNNIKISDELILDNITRLRRIVQTNSKYKHFQKVKFSKSLLIRSLNYDFKKRKTEKQKKKKQNKQKEEDPSPEIKPLSPINDLILWRKVNQIDPKAKLFIVPSNSNYQEMKKSLLKRGWQENPDSSSSLFEFKWTIKMKDIDYDNLKPSQIVNHFGKNFCFTTKLGLCRNIKNLIASDNIDIDSFYPRCYSLNDINDLDDFIEEFKFTKAESILNLFLINKIRNGIIEKDFELQTKLSLFILQRKNLNLIEIIQKNINDDYCVISPEEWNIIGSDNLTLYLNDKEKYDMISDKLDNILNIDNNLFEKVNKTLLEINLQNPQSNLHGYQNSWIVKPADLSRGRGIRLFNNLTKIFDYVIGKETLFVCQKYIEKPLIIKRKKFDIRQWVLVTQWNPLIIWFYDECYVRFGAEDYNPFDLANKYVHLTNNSIAKYSENFDNSEIEGNMWNEDELKKYIEDIQENSHRNLKYKMKEIVVWTLKCGQDIIETRKNSMELYGFDFMIDEKLNPWIIEVNSSPSLEFSTNVTEKLVKILMEDIIRVVIDYGQSIKKNKKNINTGLFKCIFKSGKIKFNK